MELFFLKNPDDEIETIKKLMKMTLVLFIRPTKRSVNDYDIMCSKSRTFVSMLELCGC